MYISVRIYVSVCVSVCTHMRTWFQRWLSAATAAASGTEESMLRPEWLVEVLVKDVMVALEAERSSSAPEDVVRPWCWCCVAATEGHRVATTGGGGQEA